MEAAHPTAVSSLDSRTDKKPVLTHLVAKLCGQVADATHANPSKDSSIAVTTAQSHAILSNENDPTQ